MVISKNRMTVQMIKFGKLLNGRPAGREAVLRIVQIINGSAGNDDIVLDFTNVEILTPSFADEALHVLWSKYGKERIKIENTMTSTVADSIKAVENEPAHK